MESLKEILQPVFEKYSQRIAAVYLFGSFARGDAQPASDVDLAVLLRDGVRDGEVDLRLEVYADCSRVLKRNDLDIVLMNRTRSLFLLEEIVRDGVVLYDDDPGYRQEFEVNVHHDFIEFRDHRKKILGV